MRRGIRRILPGERPVEGSTLATSRKPVWRSSGQRQRRVCSVNHGTGVYAEESRRTVELYRSAIRTGLKGVFARAWLHGSPYRRRQKRCSDRHR